MFASNRLPLQQRLETYFLQHNSNKKVAEMVAVEPLRLLDMAAQLIEKDEIDVVDEDLWQTILSTPPLQTELIEFVETLESQGQLMPACFNHQAEAYYLDGENPVYWVRRESGHWLKLSGFQLI